MSPDKIYKGYRSKLIKAVLGSGKLHRFTFQYINPFSKATFPGMNIRKIDRWVVFLEALNTYLIPFLIIGGVYLFFSMEINNYLPIDLPNTFYATLQETLNDIQKNKYIAFLQKQKIWFNLVFGLLIILVPLLFVRRKKLKLAQKGFNQLLVCLAILTNLSFFSGALASDSEKVTDELETVILEIEEIHSNIYRKVSNTLPKEGIDTVDKTLNDYEELYRDLKKEKEEALKSIKTTDLKQELDDVLTYFLDTLQQNQVVIKPTKVPFISKTRFDNEFNRFLEFGSSKASNTPEDLSYFFTKEKWTYKRGVDLEKKVDTYVAQMEASAKFSNSKTQAIFEEVYQFIASYGINALADMVPEINNHIYKALAKATAKASQQDVWSQFEKICKKVKTISKDKFTSIKNNTTKIKTKYRSIVRSYKGKDRLQHEIKALEERIKLELETELITEIQRYVNSIDIRDIKFNSTNEISKLNQLRELQMIRGTGIEYNVELKNNILSEFRSIIFNSQVFKMKGTKGRQYLNKLKRIDVNQVVRSSNPRNIFVSAASKMNIWCSCIFP
ncbi:hypothetical protein ACJD0Z_12120 [Flavobacteriaceae bacterium M23B6Z8]